MAHGSPDTRMSSPKSIRGAVVDNIDRCMDFDVFNEGAPWGPIHRCALVLPSSFSRGDGLKISTIGRGETKDAARESACHQAVALLLMRDCNRVFLRSMHWAIDVQTLVDRLPGSVPHVGSASWRRDGVSVQTSALVEAYNSVD